MPCSIEKWTFFVKKNVSIKLYSNLNIGTATKNAFILHLKHNKKYLSQLHLSKKIKLSIKNATICTNECWNRHEKNLIVSEMVNKKHG